MKKLIIALIGTTSILLVALEVIAMESTNGISMGVSNIHRSEYQNTDHRWGKKGVPIRQLLEEIVRQEKVKVDRTVPSRDLRVDINGLLRVNADTRVNMSDRFRGHLASYLEIPKQYVDKLAAKDVELMAINFNRLLAARDSSEARLVRMLDGKARALMSDTYAVFDHCQLTRGVLQPLMDRGLSVASAQITETKLYLKFISDIEGRVGDDVIYAGLEIGNSEVGASTVYWKLLFARVACFNVSSTALAFSRRHSGNRKTKAERSLDAVYSEETKMLDTVLTQRKLLEGVNHALNPITFERELDKYRLAQGIQIEGKASEQESVVGEVLTNYLAMSGEEHKSIHDLFFDSSNTDRSVYGLCQSITEASKFVESYDRASELEGLGHKVIEMTKSDWNGVYKAAA